MKPVLDFLVKTSDESFVTRLFDYNYFPTPWHFHPEYELVLVLESQGKRIIGDRVTEFGPGDLALLGPNLPHLYRNHPDYYNAESGLRARSIVIHFDEGSFGEGFFTLPESQKLQKLLYKSMQGIEIKGDDNVRVSRMLMDIIGLNGLQRWLKLLEILDTLAESRSLQVVNDLIVNGKNGAESERMRKVVDHVYQNFTEEISITTVAGIANMANNSFSRYFSQRTRQSFTSFVNEIRLNHAAKLLMETQRSVLEISLACGFTNLSNFNYQFKMRYHQSPLNFRKNYL